MEVSHEKLKTRDRKNQHTCTYVLKFSLKIILSTEKDLGKMKLSD